jgi:hypothetical protein
VAYILHSRKPNASISGIGCNYIVTSVTCGCVSFKTKQIETKNFKTCLKLTLKDPRYVFIFYTGFPEFTNFQKKCYVYLRTSYINKLNNKQINWLTICILLYTRVTNWDNLILTKHHYIFQPSVVIFRWHIFIENAIVHPPLCYTI